MSLLGSFDLWLPPSRQISSVQDPRKGSAGSWEPRSLVEDAISGAEFAPFGLWLPSACLPACLPCLRRDGLWVSCRLALFWYSFSCLSL